MLLTSDLNPSNDFTRILNEAIFDETLTHAEFRLWCRLLALPKAFKEIQLDIAHLAAELNMSPDLLRTQRRALKAKGFLVTTKTQMVVTIPDEGFKPKEVKLTKQQQLAADLRDVWNKEKPKNFSKKKHPLSLAEVDTLRLHAQHCEQESLTQFLATVLKGCKADDWWKDKGMSFTNVFGSGTPKQNKFTNVEKLLNLAGSKQGRAAIWSFDSDQDWLDWYQSKGHDMSKVERLEMEQDDAWVHQVANEGDGTIYVYSHEDRVVHWTYKEGQYGVSYLPTAK